MRVLLAIAALFSVGCGHYTSFVLPQLNTAGPTTASFQWAPERAPVIEHGDLTDVLNPSVVLFQGQYWNFYSEYAGTASKGTWYTSAATSPDGAKWTKVGRVISPVAGDGDYIAANGSALVVDGELLYWYETGYPLRLALARSKDGRNWTRQSGYVLEPGPYGSFDERAVGDPYVIRAGQYFYMYYLGQDRASRQRLGVARSKDGILWEKLRDNPVMDGVPGAFDENLGEPAVWNSGGEWWMLYTGRAHDETRKLGLAHSKDGIQWTRVPNFTIAGDEDWNRAVLCDPSVEPQSDGSVRVWFGGGDVAKPDQGIDGQIGVGVLKPIATGSAGTPPPAPTR